ncbi:unnamed protein product, partial [Brassica oleracea var. botrytis]
MEETYLEDTCWQINFSFLLFVLCLSLAHNLRPEKSRKKQQRSQPAAGRKSSSPSSLPPPSPINAGKSVVAGTTGKAKKKAGGARDLRILGPVLWSAIRAQSSNFGAMADLKDKVVLVTGASSGIGKEICLDLVKAGCKIIAAAHRVDRLNSLCSNINSFGSTGTQATALELDVASVQPPFEKRLRKLGKYLAYLQ